MSPEVVTKKLVAMTGYLQDLRRHEGVTFEKFMAHHYEIERILELLIMSASDITIHLLAVRGEPAPGSYRSAFARAGELNIISADLSRSLALSSGLRNILAHEYEEIDYATLHKSIASALRDFSAFIEEVSR